LSNSGVETVAWIQLPTKRRELRLRTGEVTHIVLIHRQREKSPTVLNLVKILRKHRAASRQA
jgi:hypothetical protein